MIEKSDKHYSHSLGMGNSHTYSLNSSEWEWEFTGNFHSPQISEKILFNLGNDGEWGNLTKNHSHSPGMGNGGNIDHFGNFHSHSQISPEWGMGMGIPGE